MNLEEIRAAMRNRAAGIQALSAQLLAAANDDSTPAATITSLQQQLTDARARYDALRQEADQMAHAQQGSLTPASPADEPESRDVQAMRASREYARAFAYAIQHGINRKNGKGNERVKILFDALTESGGSPTGADGGFLVPEDIEHTIIEFRRSLDPLANLFNTETVTSPTGWRVHDTAPDKGLVDVDEMGSIDDDDDQPVFAKVAYTCTKKALILPVSNELLTDNVANLFAYLGRWFAKKLVITENGMLITALRTLTASSIASDPFKGVKAALNKELDPAISVMADIILNQDAFDVLDQITDGHDRPMLQPDPTNATVKRFSGRALHSVSRRALGNVSTASDVFIGSGKDFATLFRCGGFELASTDIGGNAWRTDSSEIRGITRLGVSKFDTEAMVRKTVTVSA